VTLIQLRVLLAAARTGTSTAVVHHLAMAQPSASELVQRLEKEFGVILFLRGGSPAPAERCGEQARPVGRAVHCRRGRRYPRAVRRTIAHRR